MNKCTIVDKYKVIYSYKMFKKQHWIEKFIIQSKLGNLLH